PWPVIRGNEHSLLSFDSPHQFQFAATESLPLGLTVSPALQIRSGYPYSAVDESLNSVGPRNRAGNFPAFATLKMQVMKTIPIPVLYLPRSGVYVYNVTNDFNPRDVQNNLGTADLGTFSNSLGRVVRGRFSVEF